MGTEYLEHVVLLEMLNGLEEHNEGNFPHAPIPSNCNESAYGRTIIENSYDETLKERANDESNCSLSWQATFDASRGCAYAEDYRHSKWIRRAGEGTAGWR